MSSRAFLQALQNKLKGGNLRSIHLNALPGRLVARLDLKQLDYIRPDLSSEFLTTVLTKSSFEFPITLNQIDLNQTAWEQQKILAVISKRINSIIIDNEDYYKEHGSKTLAFGYPILIKRSTKDPTKVIKAPLFIWALEAIKSRTKVNEWTFLRNKVVKDNGKFEPADIHPILFNEVLISFIKSEDDIVLPPLSPDILEDSLLDPLELLTVCASVLHALNGGVESEHLEVLTRNYAVPVKALPESQDIDQIANPMAYIWFGGIFGLFRAQKESIITDITQLLERFDEFEFDRLAVENYSTTPFSAVDTDPNQQAIIGTLGREANQVIQGPPGTGKSQSLTALITNALANGLKSLVVCEKKTALDVIRSNLARKNEKLESLVAVIDDVNDDREAIIDSVRERQDRFYSSNSPESAKMHYETSSLSIARAVEGVNAQHRALAVSLHRGQTWAQLVGRFLKLKRSFGKVPLKHVIPQGGFLFKEGEFELHDTLEYLAEADSLYHQSLHLHSALDCLHSSLFSSENVGQAKSKLEHFVLAAENEIPKIEKKAQEAAFAAEQWLITEFSSFPEFIQEEFVPFRSYLEGDFMLGNEILNPLPLDTFLEESIRKLLVLQIAAKEFMEGYEKELNVQYNSYVESVSECASQYLQFAEENTAQYGPHFLQNDRSARFKAQILGLISRKYRLIRKNRQALQSRIAQIRKVETVKPYIGHEYNDQEKAPHLEKYVSNIRELQKQVEHLRTTYSQKVGDFSKNVSEILLHPDFAHLLPQVKFLCNECYDIMHLLSRRCKMKVETIPKTICSICEECVRSVHELEQYQENIGCIREHIAEQETIKSGILSAISFLQTGQDGLHITPTLFSHYKSLQEVIVSCNEAIRILSVIQLALPEFRTYYSWRGFIQNLSAHKRQLVHTISNQQDLNWKDAFECWYLYYLLTLHEPPNLPKNDFELEQFRKQKELFNAAQVNSILTTWAARQQAAIQSFRERGLSIHSLFNKRGSKGMRRNSLRTIISHEFSLFTDFFPALLVNPSVCSSILPLTEGLFDLVIFDEASQLRLEETYPALLRGKAKIISGDKHQMPPSSYFQTGGALLDPPDEEEETEEEEFVEERRRLNASDLNLAESESLLAFGEDKGFKQRYLDIHYRSRHPFLIDFSNHAFYGLRLIPVPPQQEYTPITFIQVDGIYENQTNPTEARRVVDLLENDIEPLPNGQIPSVGVATFNIYQRNLILQEIARRRQENASFDYKMSQFGQSFFVKNLENIQGDERDIIILSTTFGKKENGSFSQAFGPIIQSRGHRMLNVIITRAKHKVFVCTSLPPEFVNQYSQLLVKHRNRGRAALYAYLAYAKAVSDQNDELRESILQELSLQCSEKRYHTDDFGEGSESPFEDEVYSILSQHIGCERITQQYKVGGFRIDMVIHDKGTGKPTIAIECDGAKYHSSPEAYAWDLFRQAQLEQYGFTFHRIWSTAWFDATEKETDRLLNFISDRDAREMPVSSPQL